MGRKRKKQQEKPVKPPIYPPLGGPKGYGKRANLNPEWEAREQELIARARAAANAWQPERAGRLGARSGKPGPPATGQASSAEGSRGEVEALRVENQALRERVRDLELCLAKIRSIVGAA